MQKKLFDCFSLIKQEAHGMPLSCKKNPDITLPMVPIYSGSCSRLINLNFVNRALCFLFIYFYRRI